MENLCPSLIADSMKKKDVVDENHALDAVE
jgi:hypothetical protein